MNQLNDTNGLNRKRNDKSPIVYKELLKNYNNLPKSCQNQVSRLRRAAICPTDKICAAAIAGYDNHIDKAGGCGTCNGYIHLIPDENIKNLFCAKAIQYRKKKVVSDTHGTGSDAGSE
jgi:polyferredoxin